jgi:hypothetical protein
LEKTWRRFDDEVPRDVIWIRTLDVHPGKAEEEPAKSMFADGCSNVGLAGTIADRPCFSVSPDESSGNVTESHVDSTDPSVALGPGKRGGPPGEVPVETALACALSQAADAGRFDVVAQLAKELEARRLARSGMAKLDDERVRRAR